MEKKKIIKGTLLKIVQGNLLDQDVEAVVNAANPYLEGGGGIDGAIHRAAGPELAEACRAYKKSKHIEKIVVGDAVVTDSFNIKNKKKEIRYVIHTVGPDLRNRQQYQKKEELLKKAYLYSLEKAKEKGIKTLAFPAISTGIYGYPFEEAQVIVFKTLENYLENHPFEFQEVRLVYYSDADFKSAEALWDKVVDLNFPL